MSKIEFSPIVEPGTVYEPDGKAEFVCKECHRKCTQSPTSPDIEYGHQRKPDRCPNRPDDVDPISYGGRQPVVIQDG